MMRRFLRTLPFALLLLPACGSSGLGQGFDASDSGTRLKAIREVAATNDQARLPAVAQCLNDDDPAVRIAAIATLRRMTGQDLGYEPAAPAAERRAVAERFAKLLAARPAPSIDAPPAPAPPADLPTPLPTVPPAPVPVPAGNDPGPPSVAPGTAFTPGKP